MSAAETGTSLPADSIDFIYEDNGGSNFLSLLEKVTDTPSTDTDIQFNEVGAGNRQELHIGFPCHCLGKERLTCTRRADEQNAFRNAGTHLSIDFRIF